VLAPFVAPTEGGRSVASEGDDPMYWLPLIFDVPCPAPSSEMVVVTPHP